MSGPEAQGSRDEPFAWRIPRHFNFAVDVVDHWAGKGDLPCLIWEDETGNTRRYTYPEMSRLTKRLAAAYRRLGVVKGDRILIVLADRGRRRLADRRDPDPRHRDADSTGRRLQNGEFRREGLHLPGQRSRALRRGARRCCLEHGAGRGACGVDQFR